MHVGGAVPEETLRSYRQKVADYIWRALFVENGNAVQIAIKDHVDYATGVADSGYQSYVDNVSGAGCFTDCEMSAFSEVLKAEGKSVEVIVMWPRSSSPVVYGDGGAQTVTIACSSNHFSTVVDAPSTARASAASTASAAVPVPAASSRQTTSAPRGDATATTSLPSSRKGAKKPQVEAELTRADIQAMQHIICPGFKANRARAAAATAAADSEAEAVAAEARAVAAKAGAINVATAEAAAALAGKEAAVAAAEAASGRAAGRTIRAQTRRGDVPPTPGVAPSSSTRSIRHTKTSRGDTSQSPPLPSAPLLMGQRLRCSCRRAASVVARKDDSACGNASWGNCVKQRQRRQADATRQQRRVVRRTRRGGGGVAGGKSGGRIRGSNALRLSKASRCSIRCYIYVETSTSQRAGIRRHSSHREETEDPVNVAPVHSAAASSTTTLLSRRHLPLLTSASPVTGISYRRRLVSSTTPIVGISSRRHLLSSASPIAGISYRRRLPLLWSASSLLSSASAPVIISDSASCRQLPPSYLLGLSPSYLVGLLSPLHDAWKYCCLALRKVQRCLESRLPTTPSTPQDSRSPSLFLSVPGWALVLVCTGCLQAGHNKPTCPLRDRQPSTAHREPTPTAPRQTRAQARASAGGLPVIVDYVGDEDAGEGSDQGGTASTTVNDGSDTSPAASGADGADSVDTGSAGTNDTTNASGDHARPPQPEARRRTEAAPVQLGPTPGMPPAYWQPGPSACLPPKRTRREFADDTGGRVPTLGQLGPDASLLPTYDDTRRRTRGNPDHACSLIPPERTESDMHRAQSMPLHEYLRRAQENGDFGMLFGLPARIHTETFAESARGASTHSHDPAAPAKQQTVGYDIDFDGAFSVMATTDIGFLRKAEFITPDHPR
jgi:hypothetical protein